MSKKYTALAGGVLLVGAITAATLFLRDKNFQVLNPAGTIAHQERDLLIFGCLLSLIIVIPVFAMTFGIAWKYRESNHKARYTPDWDHSRLAETVWWTVPSILIFILSVMIWNSSHTLDPFKPIASHKAPLNIQVVALDWKWLFIYPDQHIATVNYLQFPVGTPVNFQITSDAAMNSFWIPQLGGQIYAMAGMSTQLHLRADRSGDFRGSSANISGRGFADMTFTARASGESDFRSWVNSVKQSPTLSMDAYHELAEPSRAVKPQFFASGEPDLFTHVIEQYLGPGGMAHGHGGSL